MIIIRNGDCKTMGDIFKMLEKNSSKIK
jgi:hypothetical protein